jgi:hypothetical protein
MSKCDPTITRIRPEQLWLFPDDQPGRRAASRTSMAVDALRDEALTPAAAIDSTQAAPLVAGRDHAQPPSAAAINSAPASPVDAEPGLVPPRSAAAIDAPAAPVDAGRDQAPPPSAAAIDSEQVDLLAQFDLDDPEVPVSGIGKCPYFHEAGRSNRAKLWWDLTERPVRYPVEGLTIAVVLLKVRVTERKHVLFVPVLVFNDTRLPLTSDTQFVTFKHRYEVWDEAKKVTEQLVEQLKSAPAAFMQRVIDRLSRMALPDSPVDPGRAQGFSGRPRCY